MNFEDFTNAIKEKIKDYLPEQYNKAKIEIIQVDKLNKNYKGLKVTLSDEFTAPCINMEAAYIDYTNGIALNDILHEMARIITTSASDVDTEVFLNYEQAKDKLFIRVSNYEKNKDMLARVPHEKIEDLAITYHVLCFTDDDNAQFATVTIHNELMKQYGITQEQLRQAAFANSQKIMPLVIEDMAFVMRNLVRNEMTKIGLSEDEINEAIAEIPAATNMYRVSNKFYTNGAAAIFYPDAMDRVAEFVGGNFYIIPSSTDEVLAILDDGNIDITNIYDMVAETNETQVDEFMQLSNEVYHYDANEKLFEKASSYTERTKQKASILRFRSKS